MRFDVISAVFNVAPFIEKFFESITSQTLSFKDNIRIICVDDGSPDESKDLIEKWRSRYPDNIVYIRQENGGQAAARNAGIKVATANYVTFIDPDDFISENYFKEVADILDAKDGGNISFVSCNFIFYFEAENRYSDAHPLRYRFQKSMTRRPVRNLGDFIQLTVNSVFFNLTELKAANVRFDPRVRPSFEDGNFVAKFALSASGDALFLKEPKYFYRKRADQSSTLDGSWLKKERYLEQIEHGYLQLLRSAGKNTPVWLQRTVLYDLFYHFKKFVDSDYPSPLSLAAERDRYFALLKEAFTYIDSKTIMDFGLAGCWFYHKFGILNLMKNQLPDIQICYLDAVDRDQEMVKVRYFVRSNIVPVRILVNGDDVTPTHTKTVRHTFLGRTYCFETYVWIALRGDQTLKVWIGAKNARLSLGGKNIYEPVPGSVIYENRRKAPSVLPIGPRLIRRAASLGPFRRLYKDAWVFIDKDNNADDNAEHIYRYILNYRPEVNAFFLLRKGSPSWSRLEKEGFRLIQYGSMAHKMSLMNARHLISSHADDFVVKSVSDRYYGDRLSYKFTFLQHGVIMFDLSEWLNRLPIDCLITTTPEEHRSIVGNNWNYKFTDKEVFRTGLARHDALWKGKKDKPRKLMIMPTWRKNLLGRQDRFGSNREAVDMFYSSSFTQSWLKLIRDEEINKLGQEFGVDPVFCLHPSLDAYFDWFKGQTNIEVLRFRDVPSIQELLQDTALLVTDYSSIAFDVAFLNRPIVYYQFDSGDIFSGGHTSRAGYFDFNKHGFGPVTTTSRGVVSAIRKALVGNEKKVFVDRREQAFPSRDGMNCKAIFDVISRL